jgi:uncharacterized membrane protein YdjX (TVP38/TMEM64 family)
MVQRSAWRTWTALAALALALILIPFFLFEDAVNQWAASLLRPGRRDPAIAAAVVALLGLDVVLPIPSSLVSTAAGITLGFLPGWAASTAGMTLGSLAGYALGRSFGLPLVRRLTDGRDLERVADRFRRSAPWALAAMRPVPVLAEASALVAGVSRMHVPAYFVVTTLANAGISAIYCGTGANAGGAASFFLAFAASLALPGAAMLVDRLLARRRQSLQ